MARCYSCGAELPERIVRSTLCPACGKDAKVCLNCAFYAPGLQWDCKERIDEGVTEKDRANFCGYFSPETRRTAPGPGAEKKDPSAEAKRAFLDLFGDET